MMEKEKYIEPELEMIQFEVIDIVCTSTDCPENEITCTNDEF
jgi:hypothetical protein